MKIQNIFKKIQVLWLIEHVAREMDVACIVSYYLKKKYGIDVIIKHIYQHASEIMSKYEPKIIVLPFFYNSKDLAIRDYVKRWPNALYFNLAFEQLFYNAFKKIKAPADDFTRKKVFHHAWSKTSKTYLRKAGVIDNHIFLNGNPIYQLYRKPYRSFFINRKELAKKYRLDKNKKWVFIPENYRWAFYNDYKLQRLVDQGGNIDELYRMRDFSRTSFEIVLKWCHKLANEKDIEIIIRPRPATQSKEIISFYQHKVGKIPQNLHFIKEGSVREWILASNVAISSISTSLIESSIAGKPSYIVEPKPIIRSLHHRWYDLLSHLRTWEEFYKACKKLTKNNSHLKLQRWAIKNMLHNKDPLINLADFIYLLLRQKKEMIEFSRIFSILRIRLLNKNINYFNILTHEMDKFTDDSVNKCAKRWTKTIDGNI